LKNTRMILKY